MATEANVGGSEKELQRWEQTRALMGKDRILLGPYFSYILRQTPRRLLHMLSYYKFAAKMIGKNQRVLDVGCSEGIGTILLAEFAETCVGIDIDAAAIQVAEEGELRKGIQFRVADILKEKIGIFDAVVNFDVIEHVYPENADQFLEALGRHLHDDGMLIVGTPNITSDVYASPVTKSGHVNLYSGERLTESLEKYFKKVLLFSANDEVVHTGFAPMAHYLIAVGIGKK